MGAGAADPALSTVLDELARCIRWVFTQGRHAATRGATKAYVPIDKASPKQNARAFSPGRLAPRSAEQCEGASAKAGGSAGLILE
jgi:hypothetical protein